MDKYKASEAVLAYRAGIADRATWFYLLLQAAEKQNANTDKMAEEAIFQFGMEKGKKLGDIKNAADFAEALSKGYGFQAFCMEKAEISPELSVLRFHHCELVETWKKRGLGDEEISRLCRLARWGDLGMVSNFRGLTLEFPRVIADGDDCCELKITCGEIE